MKYTYILFICMIGIFSNALQAQVLSVASGSGFNVKSGTVISADGLDLTPSADFNLTTSLIHSTTVNSATTIPHINRVYQFSATTAAFSGDLKINYKDSELNGLTETALQLLLQNGTNWSLNGGTTNSSLNYVQNTVASKTLNELTLGICVTPNAPTASGTFICPSSSATLVATGVGTIKWYDALTGGNLLYTGTTFSTPILTATTIYYAEDTTCASSTRTAVTVTVNPNVTYYADADHDGYGNLAVTQVSCFGAPIGYVANNTDCDDTNATKWRSATLYVDVDGDHYTIGVGQVFCYGATVPTGYSATTLGTDCDDTRANTHPNAVEICSDGIDNDCNGVIDNVGLPGGCAPLVSYVAPAQCGSTLNLIDDQVYAALIANAQGYRWRITKMIGAVPSTIPADIQMLDTSLRVFKFTQLASYAFDTNYQIEVAVRINNNWLPYFGNPCTVRTPATTTKVMDAQCGTTITLMTDVVYANLISYATGYRFKVTNLFTNYVQVIDRNVREFRFNLLTNIPYSTAFKVEVAVRNTNGTYLPYGPSCTINTPIFPTTSLQNSQCDYTATSATEVIYANLVASASNYRFSVTNSSIGYGYVFDTTLRSFALNTVPSLLPATTYSVKVMVKIGGVWGTYGKICTLTTPGTGRVIVSKMALVFDATAYPNPFAENFKLEVKTYSEEMLQVKVYDMLGKLIENRILDITQVDKFEVGSNYPSGVYNVIVSQGDTIKTLRVIKR